MSLFSFIFFDNSHSQFLHDSNRVHPFTKFFLIAHGERNKTITTLKLILLSPKQ